MKIPFCSTVRISVQGGDCQTLGGVRITRLCWLKHSLLGSTSIITDTVDEMQGIRICISNNAPGETDLLVQRRTRNLRKCTTFVSAYQRCQLIVKMLG